MIFAHGYASSAATYATLEQQVAAAGFVVAAPDFPLSSTAITSEPVRDPVAQATDVSFVIDSLFDSATRPPSWRTQSPLLQSASSVTPTAGSPLPASRTTPTTPTPASVPR